MKTIAVFFGGKSPEHDISILTGLQTLASIKKEHNVVPVYIAKNGVWWTGEKLFLLKTFKNFCPKNLKQCFLKPAEKKLFVKSALKTKSINLDCAILAVHGSNGEDGTLQGALRLSEIPFSSCDVMSSSVCMDKAVCKSIFLANSIKTPKFFSFFDFEWQKNEQEILEKIERFGFDVVIKPCRAGSSVGVCKCKTKQEVISAVCVALKFDEKIIVERAITDFREINLACFGNCEIQKFSCFEEVKGQKDILDFDEKYLNTKNVLRVVDAKLEKEQKEKIFEMAKKAFVCCECFGVVRMDFFVCEDEIFLNEINTIPGSLANFLFKGETFSSLCNKLANLAIQRESNREKLIFSLKTGAIEKFLNVSNSKLLK